VFANRESWRYTRSPAARHARAGDTIRKATRNTWGAVSVNALHALRIDAVPVDSPPQPALRECVARAVRRYLVDLGEHEVDDLYDVVLREIEMPLFAEVMRHCEGNQTRAAATLGINRATLRKKLKQYKHD
jgi:Fis family transcriptional regulator